MSKVGHVEGWLFRGVVYPVRQAVEDTDPEFTARHGGQHKVSLSAGLDEWYAALDAAVERFEAEHGTPAERIVSDSPRDNGAPDKPTACGHTLAKCQHCGTAKLKGLTAAELQAVLALVNHYYGHSYSYEDLQRHVNALEWLTWRNGVHPDQTLYSEADFTGNPGVELVGPTRSEEAS